MARRARAPLLFALIAALLRRTTSDATTAASNATPAAANETAAAPPPPPLPSIRLSRPTNGSFVVDGMKTLLDVRIDVTGGNFSEADVAGARLCIATTLDEPDALAAAGREQCWADASPRFLVTTAGQHMIRPYLRAGGAGGRLLLRGDAAAFTSGPPSTCNGTAFGRLPCMITRPNCGRFLKFRFYLYPPAVPLPSAAAAALYIELQKSPLRTDDPFGACVYVAINDVRAANVMGESLEASATKFARLPLWGSGENHVVFSFGDYGPGFDTGRAIIAASSFGPPLDVAWFAARGGDASKMPAAVALRPGYDVVMPLPFFRCNMPEFAHLNKYREGAAAAAAARPPSARAVLLSFKGAAYEFPPGHPAEPRLTLRRTAHNGRDVVVALTCWALAPTCAPCVAPACTSPPLQNTTTANFPECAEWTHEATAR